MKLFLLLLCPLYVYCQPECHNLVQYSGVVLPTGNICETQPEWKLAYHDEFGGNAIDQSKWYTYFPYGENGSDDCSFCRTHGNDENQYYDDGNVVVENGFLKLVIEDTPAEWYGEQKEYTSGLIYSKKLFEPLSKYEIRAKIPGDPGFWPAAWIFGTSYPSDGRSSEVDILEMDTEEPYIPRISVHKWFNGESCIIPSDLEYTEDLSQDFHIYTYEHNRYFLKFYIDGNLIYQISKLYYTNGINVTNCFTTAGPYLTDAYFPGNQNMNIICNLAVGTGGFASPPNNETIFPNTFEIDYIRVYQRTIQSDLDDICNSVQINGSDVLCNDGLSHNYDFSINHLDGRSVTCNSSSNINIISCNSSSITVSNTSSTGASGWIEITLSGNSYCPEKTFRKEVWVGRPNPIVTFSIKKDCVQALLTVENQNSTNYEWLVLSGGTIAYSNTRGTAFVNLDENATQLVVRLIATNDCGTTYYNNTFELPDCSEFQNGRSFTASPNPTNGDIQVTIDEEFNLINFSKLIFIGNSGYYSEYNSEEINGRIININTSNCPAGQCYIILITTQNIIYTKAIQKINN